MKTLAIIIMLIALFLLYKIAYQKPSVSPKTKKDLPEKESETTDDIVGKSRFVRVQRSQMKPNDATIEEPDNQTEKDFTFAHQTEKTGVIPTENLDEVFDESDLEIEEDEDDDDELDLEEEAEIIQEMNGKEIAYADGFTFDEMAEAITSGNNPEILYNLSKTDMFEQLVSGGRNARITAILEKYEKNLVVEQENNDNEHSDFDIADYLS